MHSRFLTYDECLRLVKIAGERRPEHVARNPRDAERLLHEISGRECFLRLCHPPQDEYRVGLARSDFGRRLNHLKEASPIGLTELAWAFMWYFCTVLLGLIFSDATLGWFGASPRALMALHSFVWLYFFNVLPSISR